MLSRMLPRSPAAGAARTAPVGTRAVAAVARVARYALDWLCLRFAMRASPVPALEFAHERDQRLDAGERHGVVQAGAHAAEHPVALEAVQPGARRPAARNAASSAACASVKVTFIHERASFATRLRYSAEPSMAAYSACGLGPVALAHGGQAARFSSAI